MGTLKSLTSLELIALLRNSDHRAFSEIYERYWKKLLYFAAQRTEDFAEAENIVQDIFISLWEKRAVLQVSSTVDNYLYASVKYRIIKLLDRKRTQRLYQETRARYADTLDDSMQQYLDFEELQLRLEEIIGSLPEQSRLIYRMSKEEGRSHKYIAGELGLSEKAVNARLVRIKRQLRTGLDAFLTVFLL